MMGLEKRRSEKKEGEPRRREGKEAKDDRLTDGREEKQQHQHSLEKRFYRRFKSR